MFNPLVKTCLFIISILFIGSCKDDDPGSLTIHFIPRFDDQPLRVFNPIDLVDENDIQFSHVSLLVSDLELLTGTSSHFLDDIELVNLSFDDLTSASEGYTLHLDQIPARRYTGIKFGIGVPPDDNHKTPSQFPSSSVLSNTGYYWQAWASFIFSKIEGTIDTPAPGNFETSFAYHTGTDQLYRVFDSDIPIEITDGNNTELNIALDLADLLTGIDIESNPQNHNPQDTVQIIRIVNNLQSSIKLFQ